MARQSRIVACILAAAACFVAEAADVRFGNTFTYDVTTERSAVTIDEITNRSTTASGRLRVSLWAASVQPRRDGPLGGAHIATFQTLEPLAPGARYAGITLSAPSLELPRGRWWMVLLLEELGDGFCFADPPCQRDLLSSNVRASFGASLPPHALENPAPGSFQSGIGLISGWSCEGNLNAMIDGHVPTILLPRNSLRADTASACGGAIVNGFAVLLNYNTLGPGTHTIVLYQSVPGVPETVALTDPVPFTVTVPMGEFARGLERTIEIPNFPTPGRTTTLIWQESQQNFAIKSVSP